MKIALGHIASVQTGVFAKQVSEGEIVYLQTKHFDENGQLKTSVYPDLKADTITDKHMLRHGDVLFAAKGTKNFATWFEKTNQPAVASTSFFVIRLQRDYSSKILPAFLVWLINHPTSQQFLKGKAIGSSIVSISKTVLEELEIFIPNIETQKAILQITNLRNEEKKLKLEIDSLREKQIQQQILNTIKSDKI